MQQKNSKQASKIGLLLVFFNQICAQFVDQKLFNGIDNQLDILT